MKSGAKLYCKIILVAEEEKLMQGKVHVRNLVHYITKPD